MYVAKFHDTICVPHVFTKKSQKTTKTDIDIAKKRYREARDG
jgi:phage-related protein